MAAVGDVAPRTLQLRFGSWNAAVEEAGFVPRDGIEAMERPDRCPLCESEQGSLDFHHWNYGEQPFGCYFCRECHDVVHDGKGARTNENWLKHSVFNLIEAHVDEGHPPVVEDVVSRYNLARLVPLVKLALDSS
mgnify:FL=1